MGKKIIGIILCICGIGLALLLFTETGSDSQQALLEKAIYVSDGKVDPANEGKVVIAAGKISPFENARDPDLELDFNSPVIRRSARVLKEVGTGNEKKKSWETTPSSSGFFQRKPLPAPSSWAISSLKTAC